MLTAYRYQINRGKHLAVKPTFAERYVRLKSLGEAYLPKNLEQRISKRDKFKSANTIEKKFQITVMDMVIEIKRFRLVPQTKIAAAREIAEKHGVKTEADIENLEKRLKVLPELIISARNEVADEQLKLKCVSDLITAYEKIVEGNYIYNLIRAQKEQEQSRTPDNPNLKKS